MWYWLSRGADDAGRAKLEAALLRPLPGRAHKVSKELVQHELAMFKRALTSVGAK